MNEGYSGVEMLKVLCCPACKGDLEMINEKDIVCKSCKKSFLYKDGVFVLLE